MSAHLCNCAGTAPGYPQHETYCGQEPDDDPPPFEFGESLGCPDCTTGEPHACPFVYAAAMPEPRRAAVLKHMREALSDED